MAGPSSDFNIDHSRAVLPLWFSLIYMFLLFVFVVLSYVPYGRLLGQGGANLLALLCVMFPCVLSRSHMASWVRCGT